MKKLHSLYDITVVSFALFAMFLGAGNIIFPPFIGAQAGWFWLLACLGFVITGIGLPVAGVVAIGFADGSPDNVADKVAPDFSKILSSVLLLFIGPLFAIPRTAATTVELSLLPYLPESIAPKSVLVIGAAVFFLFCFYFVITPTKTIDRIGTFLTPLLLLFLLIIIGLSIFKPIAAPTAPADLNVVQAAHLGFTTGYQTMDALGAMVFGGIIYETLRSKGYSKERSKALLLPIAGICGCGLLAVYGGLIWLGASDSAALQHISIKTELTSQAVFHLAGKPGQILLSIVILLACCTTAIGLLLSASKHFHNLLRNKFSFKTVAVACTLLSYAISILGVEGIIKLAAPVLEILYPLIIVLIVLALCGKRLRYRYIYSGAILAAMPAAVLNVLRLYLVTKPFADAWLPLFPFGDAGFGCFIPALFGAFFGDWLGKSRELEGKLPATALAQVTDNDTNASSSC